jgi:predicted nucleic acid-binding protein
MAFRRLLTNPKVMNEDVLSPAQAIQVYRELLSDERVRFEAEPLDVETAWFSLMGIPTASGSTWTDGYLAAFALEAKFRLVTFDRGMRRWPALALELLIPA